MAITSIGYAGSINTTQFANLADHLGVSYNIVGEGDFNATATSGDRQLSIAPGTATGRGVRDTKTGSDIVQMPPISSGTRYDLVALRRNWNTGVTSLVVIQGTSTRAVPGRMTNPGDQDDHPLWLVRVQAGLSAVQEVIDLRVWNRNGGATAKDPMVRSFMNGVGQKIRIGTDVHQIGFNTAGQAVWIKVEDPAFINDYAVQLYGVGTAMHGSISSKAPGLPFQMQAATTVTTTDAAGWCRITFPRTFPNGLLTFQAMNGDGGIGCLIFEIAGHPYNVYGPSVRREDVVLRVWRDHTIVMARTMIRINWLAIGW